MTMILNEEKIRQAVRKALMETYGFDKAANKIKAAPQQGKVTDPDKTQGVRGKNIHANVPQGIFAEGKDEDLCEECEPHLEEGEGKWWEEGAGAEGDDQPGRGYSKGHKPAGLEESFVPAEKEHLRANRLFLNEELMRRWIPKKKKKEVL